VLKESNNVHENERSKGEREKYEDKQTRWRDENTKRAEKEDFKKSGIQADNNSKSKGKI